MEHFNFFLLIASVEVALVGFFFYKMKKSAK